MGHRNSPVDLRVNDRRKEFPHLKVIKEELEGLERACGITSHSLRSWGGMKKELVRWENTQVSTGWLFDNNFSKLCCFLSTAIMVASLLTQPQQPLHGFHRTLLLSRAHTPGFELAGAGQSSKGLEFPVIYYQKRVMVAQRIVPQPDLPPCLLRAVEFNPEPSCWASPPCLA